MKNNITICLFPSGYCPANSFKVGEDCMFVINRNETFSEARAECQTFNGSDLASFRQEWQASLDALTQ